MKKTSTAEKLPSAADTLDAFHEAAKLGDIEWLKSALASGVPIDEFNKGPSYNTLNYNALYHAVKNKQVEAVKFLLENGANPNARPAGASVTRPCLDEDIRGELNDPDQRKIAHLLVDAGIKLDRCSARYAVIPLISLLMNPEFCEKMKAKLPGWIKTTTPMQRASQLSLSFLIKNGRTDLIQHYHEVGILDDAKLSLNGESPIMSAIESGQLGVAKLFLSMGYDINEKSVLGETPLIGALSCGDKDAIRWVIKNGGDINVHDDYGCPALMYSLGRKEIYDYFLSFKPSTDLSHVSMIGICDFVKNWIGNGNNFGLHQFFEGHSFSILEVDNAFRRGKGKRCTMISLAIESELSAHMCSTLIKLGLDPNRLDHDGKTELSNCIELRRIDAAKTLIENGADPLLKSSLDGVNFFRAAQHKDAQDEFKIYARSLQARISLSAKNITAIGGHKKSISRAKS